MLPLLSVCVCIPICACVTYVIGRGEDSTLKYLFFLFQSHSYSCTLYSRLAFNRHLIVLNLNGSISYIVSHANVWANVWKNSSFSFCFHHLKMHNLFVYLLFILPIQIWSTPMRVRGGGMPAKRGGHKRISYPEWLIIERKMWKKMWSLFHFIIQIISIIKLNCCIVVCMYRDDSANAKEISHQTSTSYTSHSSSNVIGIRWKICSDLKQDNFVWNKINRLPHRFHFTCRLPNCANK